MLNQFMCVGRVVNNPMEITNEEGKKYVEISLSIPRSYKNELGEYETDIINVVLYNTIAKSTLEYCKKGDLIGIRGRVENNNGRFEIIADRVSFLSSNNSN